MITRVNFNYTNTYFRNKFNTSYASFKGNIDKQQTADSTSESKETYEEITHYANGQIESRIVFDKKTKRKIEETFYYKNGKKSSQTTYNPETGVIESYREWFDTGKRMSRTCYDSKGRILEDISWYDDGSVRSYRREDGSSSPIYEVY